MKEKTDIYKKLQKFGLSETEARVYYFTLALEESTVDKIAQRAEVNRTSCYAILERLLTLGLASRLKKKNKTVFQAVNPDKLIEILEEKKKEIQEIIPDLKSLFEISEGRMDVKFYEGKEGLKTVLNERLKEAKEVLIFGDGDNFKKIIPGWTEIYSVKMVATGQKSKLILKATIETIKAAKKLRELSDEKSRLTKIRLLPDAYRLDYGGFDVYNNKTILYSFEKKNIAVVIENKAISQMMRTIFEILWNEAGKYDNTILKN